MLRRGRRNHNGYLPAVCLANPGSNPPTSPPADIQAVCGSASNSSGISYNNVTTPTGDTYPGLHNIISNNIITGEVDQCEFWPAQLCPGATSSSSEFPTDYVWSANNAIPYHYSDDPAIPSTVVFDANLYYGRPDGACCNFSPQPAQNFISGDRFFFADPPFVHPTAPGQYAASRPPSAVTPTYSASTECTGWIPICDISSAFAPGSGPAYDAGTDPSSSALTSGWPQVQADMRNYICSDINGNARRVTGTGWDAGAILYSARPSLTH